MANADRPKGFRPYGTFQAIRVVAGAQVYAGEFVTLADDGKVDPSTAGAAIYGLALTTAKDGEDLMVSVDPNQLYVGQASADEIDAQTDIGNNCDILATAGNSTFRAARQEINTATLAASAAQLQVVAIERRVDNAFGANVDVVVKVNESQVFGANGFAGI